MIDVDDLVVASSIGFGAVWIADAMPAGAVTDADLPITIAGDATHSRASSAHGVGDADGDGYTDLVVYTSSASQYLLSGPIDTAARLTGAAATFGDAADPMVSQGPAGDLDGDGTPDLLLPVFEQGAVYVLGAI